MRPLRRLRSLLLFAVLTVGCAGVGEEAEVLDLRRSFPAPAGDSIVFRPPAYEIPAGTEKQWCWATTYDGPDVGIIESHNYQVPGGHHVVLFGTSETERNLPDGEVWDCTETDSLNMASFEPVIIGGSIEIDEEGVSNDFILPEGIAAYLGSGQRLVLQSHYVNVTGSTILVQDEAQFRTVPEDSVETWAAPWVNTTDNFAVPPHSEDYTVEFDCTWDGDYELLQFGGHLHEWGRAISTSMTTADTGDTEVIYDVPDWAPVMRDAPPYHEFLPGEFIVKSGDSFHTTCTWFNNQDEELIFPREMCVVFGMAYPSKIPIICAAD